MYAIAQFSSLPITSADPNAPHSKNFALHNTTSIPALMLLLFGSQASKVQRKSHFKLSSSNYATDSPIIWPILPLVTGYLAFPSKSHKALSTSVFMNTNGR